jgi:hypothetical protein
MVLEVILVIAVLPLVALGLSLAWSNRLGRRRPIDDEVEAAGFVRSRR